MKYKQSIYNFSFTENGKIYIYNTFSGALAKLDEPLQENLLEEKYISQLKQQGFIVAQEADEQNKFLIERNMYVYDHKDAMLQYVIAPTMKCNAKCLYCFENGTTTKNIMSYETAKMVVEFILNDVLISSPKKIWIKWFGGEPLLNINIIDYIATETKKICEQYDVIFNSNIITNGILFTKDTAAWLVEKSNLQSAQITIDGLQENYQKFKGIDAFDTVVKNICEASQIVSINVRLNVTNRNDQDVMPLLDLLLREKKLDGKIKVHIARVIDYEQQSGGDQSVYFTREDFSHLMKNIYSNTNYKSLTVDSIKPKPRRTYCVMENYMNCAIDPDGKLYKCEHVLGKHEFTTGNVSDGRFFNKKDAEFLNGDLRKCLEERCSLLPFCAAGCRSAQVYENTPIDCEQEKKRLLDLLSIVVNK